MNAKHRRPAQLTPDQVELLEGDTNTEARLELAHATAAALVPSRNRSFEPADRERVLAVIDAEGIDAVAESWVDAPELSLPGVLWRGYLLREWIRRYPDVVTHRYTAARVAFGEENDKESALVSTPAMVKMTWDNVFSGEFEGDFTDVVRQSARLTDFLSRVEPIWIDDDEHPLATEVTRRDTAMARVADDFRRAGEELVAGRLA